MLHRESFRTDGIEQSIGPFRFTPRGVLLINRTAVDARFFDDAGFEYDAPAHVAATYPLNIPTTRLRGGVVSPIAADDPGSLQATVTDAETILSTAQLATISVGSGPGLKSAAVHSSVPLTFATGTLLTFAWDTERWDTGGFFNPALNTRLTLAAGIYIVGANVVWGGNPAGVRELILFLDGNILGDDEVQATSAGPTTQGLSTVVAASTGSVLVLQGAQSSGGNLNATVENVLPTLWAVQIQ